MIRDLILPPSELSPAYFWYLNGPMKPSALRKQLREMAKAGIRNVCPHPWPAEFRPQQHPEAMTPDYLSEEYFDCFRVILEECKKLGMSCYLYDEGGWPSGNACGKVRASGGDKWSPMYWTKHGIEISPAQPEKTAPAINSLMQEPTDKFLELTHEAYYRHFGSEFGRTLRFAFMDEPRVPATFLKHFVSWCPDLAEQFRKHCGYELEPHLSSLVDDTALETVKIDFHDLISKLFVRRFLLPIRNWCRKHGMLNGGHFGGEDEHELAILHGHGHIMRSLRALDLPGVDAIWRQIFPDKENRQFPKLASSIAHQAGRKQTLGELFAVYGNGLTPENRKFLIDYMLVRGINTLVFSKIAISHKKQFILGCRPHFGPIDPLWKYSRNMHDYTARAAWLLTRGTPVIPNAVYFDMRSVWAGGKYLTDAVAKQCEITDLLMKKQCDFDFVDDDALEKAGICNGIIRIGKMSYQTLTMTESSFLPQKVKNIAENFVSSAPVPLLKVEPETPELRVCKRKWGKRMIYFCVNESGKALDVTLTLAESPVLYLDLHDLWEYRLSSPSFSWHFEPFSSAFFITGKAGNKDLEYFEAEKELTSSWTLRPLRKHIVAESDLEIIPCKDKAVSAELGDWSPILGRDFSGDAVYRTIFHTDRTDLTLDLGKVCFCASVKLNNVELGSRFLPPYRFPLADALKKGRNVLEITVSNTLGNALAAPGVLERIQEAYPPCSTYEKQQREFEKDSLVSGLFGPVMFGRFQKKVME
ncbi:MAG: hypothetical protein E7051_02175 [Lentisphaerae bacterium]|nr:hypothetical protein [Lentisphaerota bacterium]